MSAKDSCNAKLEATTISQILHLFGQGNLTFMREKQEILKTDVWQPCLSSDNYSLG